jgi:uncharacterized membrane protein YhhN
LVPVLATPLLRRLCALGMICFFLAQLVYSLVTPFKYYRMVSRVYDETLCQAH